MEVAKGREIIWTHIAIENTKKIHQFYIKTANRKVADKIVEQIFNFVKSLSHSSFVGQTEECLKKLKKDHRYLVLDHCKIIYTIEKNKVFITHVFDTRQNPKKLK
jgi:plasmid stabilization system protein ParE